MSRSTVDLQSVRFFLGYGLIFMLQSALTILIAAGVMIAVNPMLALVALAPMPFVIWVAFRYGRRNRPAVAGGPAADRRADRRGRGERVGRARGQGLRAGASASCAASTTPSGACSTSRWSPPGCAPSTTPSSASCPSSGWRRSCSWAAARRSTARSRVGEFVAFYGYVVMLTGADAHARRVAGHGPARGGLRRAGVRDPRPRARS